MAIAAKASLISTRSTELASQPARCSACRTAGIGPRLTGRSAPVVRGIMRGGMTALGGLGHALPYLIPHFYVATSVAFAVVAVELAVISWIRTRYMDTPFLQAAFPVILGGVLVIVVGILIGSS
jgi:erythrin-vacuolar iron transport family protein